MKLSRILAVLLLLLMAGPLVFAAGCAGPQQRPTGAQQDTRWPQWRPAWVRDGRWDPHWVKNEPYRPWPL